MKFYFLLGLYGVGIVKLWNNTDAAVATWNGTIGHGESYIIRSIYVATFHTFV